MGLIQSDHELSVETLGKGFTEITGELRGWLDRIGADSGLLTVFIRHTSASLIIQENADRNVRLDLLDALELLAPEDRHYAHAEEGPDDMPSHIKAMVNAVSLNSPVTGGVMVLGTWQGVFVLEHRAAPHLRHVALNFIGHSSGI
jgi:secondary thiamine-phosphate synthase enzyme